MRNKKENPLDTIETKLTDYVDNLFCDIYKELHIENGDISPYDNMRLKVTISQLAERIHDVVLRNASGN